MSQHCKFSFPPLLQNLLIPMTYGVQLKVETLLSDTSFVIYCLALSFLVASAETDSKQSPILISCYIFSKAWKEKWMGNIVKVLFCLEDQNSVFQM